MNDVNIPLLRKAVEWAEAEAKRPPSVSQWRQASYVMPEEHRIELYNHAPGCGTAFCIAGYVAYLEDERFASEEAVDGMHAEDVATKALGISEYEAAVLFSGNNTIHQVRRTAERIAGGEL